MLKWIQTSLEHFSIQTEWLDNRIWQAILIVVLSLVLAGISRVLFNRILPLFTRRTRSNLDDQIFGHLQSPVFFTVLLLGLSWSASRLISSPSTLFLLFGITKTLLVLLWVLGIGRSSHVLLQWLQSQQERFQVVRPRTLPLFDILAKTIIYGGGLYFLFLSWDIDLTAWLASAGILGIAIGFAAKDSLSNLFAGIFILADAPYKIGDYVILGQGERGHVVDIGVRSTRIMTRDEIQIIVPNGLIAASKIVNESAGPFERERIRVTIPVAYGVDLQLVRKTLEQSATDCQWILEAPEPRVRLREFGDSGLIFQLMGWIERPALRGRAIDDLLTTIYDRFKSQNIEIPYTKQDIYVKELPASQ